MIVETVVENRYNIFTNSSCGENTKDKVLKLFKKWNEENKKQSKKDVENFLKM